MAAGAGSGWSRPSFTMGRRYNIRQYEQLHRTSQRRHSLWNHLHRAFFLSASPKRQVGCAVVAFILADFIDSGVRFSMSSRNSQRGDHSDRSYVRVGRVCVRTVPGFLQISIRCFPWAGGRAFCRGSCLCAFVGIIVQPVMPILWSQVFFQPVDLTIRFSPPLAASWSAVAQPLERMPKK